MGLIYLTTSHTDALTNSAPWRSWRLPASVVARASSSASADTRARCLRWRRAPLASLVLALDQPRVRLVYLHDAVELPQILAARFAESVQQEPRGFLRHADFFGELHRADPLPRGHEQVHGVEPLVQRNVTALHHRAGADGEVLRARETAVVPSLPRRDPLNALADRAGHANRPQAGLQIDPSGFRVREPLEELKSRNGALGHDASARMAAAGDVAVFVSLDAVDLHARETLPRRLDHIV